MANIGLLLTAFLAVVCYTQADSKVFCYCNSKGYFRDGQGKFDTPFLEPALQFCTHLIYGHAGINVETHKLVPLNEQFDVTRNNYRTITDLKRRFPGLRVLLSVGGDADDVDREKYNTLLESVETRLAFVNSAHTLVKAYGFDGLDLGWEFNPTYPKKERGTISSIWHSFKSTVGLTSEEIDPKASEHKEQFTALVREVKNAFRHDGLLLTVSVLPNINSTLFHDVRNLAPNVDFVILHAYDYYTAARNKKLVDFPAPLYELIDRRPDENADYLVRYWLTNGCPNNKVLLAIPTYGRTWKMNEDSGITGVPPFTTKGAGEAGPYTAEEGLYSYPEVCAKLPNNDNKKLGAQLLRKVGDPSKRYEEVWHVPDVSKRYGTYAYRLPGDEVEGIWVGYEDPDTAGSKAAYCRAKGLGGIAVVDLTLDDFRGLCTGDKYPVLRAAKFRL